MSAKPFRFHPEAKTDLREAVLWYRERNREIALEFRSVVSEVVRRIAKSPQRWPAYLKGTRRYVLQRFPFSVVYLDESDVVYIIAVAHAKRKPGYWKKRL